MEVRIECTPEEFERLRELCPEVGEIRIRTQPQKQQKKAPDAYTPEFENFWAIYPRKTSKALAYAAWNARLNEGVSENQLMEAAQNYADFMKQERTEEGFMLHAATFCGPHQRWKDYIIPRATRKMFDKSAYVP